MGNILRYVDFEKLCHVIEFFIFKKYFGAEEIKVPFSLISRVIEWHKNIFMNYNIVRIKIISERNITS